MLPEFAWPVRIAIPDHDHLRELLLNEKREKLAAIAGSLRAEGVETTWDVLTGRTSIEVVREVIRHQHDLVVRTAKGPRSRQSGF